MVCNLGSMAGTQASAISPGHSSGLQALPRADFAPHRLRLPSTNRGAGRKNPLFVSVCGNGLPLRDALLERLRAPIVSIVSGCAGDEPVEDGGILGGCSPRLPERYSSEPSKFLIRFSNEFKETESLKLTLSFRRHPPRLRRSNLSYTCSTL